MIGFICVLFFFGLLICIWLNCFFNLVKNVFLILLGIKICVLVVYIWLVLLIILFVVVLVVFLIFMLFRMIYGDLLLSFNDIFLKFLVVFFIILELVGFDFVNDIMCILGCLDKGFLILVLLLLIRLNIFLGILILLKILVKIIVVNGVFLDGLSIIGLLVVNVVVNFNDVWFVGKFYGVINLDILIVFLIIKLFLWCFLNL